MYVEELIKEQFSEVKRQLTELRQMIEQQGQKPSKNRIYDMHEACKRMNISYTTVNRLKKDGSLKTFRVKSKYYTREEDIINYINRNNF